MARLSYDMGTQADWWFTDDGEIVSLVEQVARSVAWCYHLPDLEGDLRAEGWLYLSVRPHLQGKTVGNLAIRLRRYLSDIALAEKREGDYERVETH